ncbi:MAG: 4-(cytidine 5'-diphospho)-2-C-methyl-D-erythritol kinase [Bacteroidales bacterium]|jgi:4-diphosphocytidyl-2-C-methyl-D-erythritol kinase|nr:4-(cytidine 5'-diphospho)-2-C-methyl-D-erythritol kinase [Bacteroidales bacterium]
MIVYPNAKINIGLKILGKRADGFHDIETLFYPVDLCDVLEIVEAPLFKMFQYSSEEDYMGDFSICPSKDNLCTKAYNLLASDFHIPPVEIHLFKQIPVGAGFGGGSSDAAATIGLLNKMFGLGIDRKAEAEYASRLGSDCPFFIFGGPMIGKGRGEILSGFDRGGKKFDLSDYGYSVKLVAPNIFVSTKEAYASVRSRNERKAAGEKIDERPLEKLLELPVEQWRDVVVNDFEESLFERHPALRDIKKDLYDQGAVYASMSGSGSALFGIFRNKEKSKEDK